MRPHYAVAKCRLQISSTTNEKQGHASTRPKKRGPKNDEGKKRRTKRHMRAPDVLDCWSDKAKTRQPSRHRREKTTQASVAENVRARKKAVTSWLCWLWGFNKISEAGVHMLSSFRATQEPERCRMPDAQLREATGVYLQSRMTATPRGRSIENSRFVRPFI